MSPLLCNIVLHELDNFVEGEIRTKYTIGKKRKTNLEYRKLRYRIKKETNLRRRRKLINESFKVPSKLINDDGLKRIHYARYADDWIIMVAGPYKDAKDIRRKVAEKLLKLGVILNMEKTTINSLRKETSRFLGVDIKIRKTTGEHLKPVRLVKKNNKHIRQRFAPRLILLAPIEEILIKLKDRGFVKRNTKREFIPIGKGACTPLTHPQILNYYNSKIRGILNCYSCVHNRNELWSVVRFLHYSCALTLARKFKLRIIRKTFLKFGRNLEFTNDNGKKYRIHKPLNLRMLPLNQRFKTTDNYDIDKLLNKT